MAAPYRITKGKRHACGDAFAVQQSVAIASLGFKRMAEGMAKVEQCSRAVQFLFIGRDDAGLGLD